MDLLDPAREAFTQGLQVAATVSGVLVAAAAIFVARLLARERDGHATPAREIALAPKVAVEQPCG